MNALPMLNDPTVCICPTGPTTVARFEAEQLVSVELRHRRDCGRRSTYADPRDYLAEMPRR